MSAGTPPDPQVPLLVDKLKESVSMGVHLSYMSSSGCAEERNFYTVEQTVGMSSALFVISLWFRENAELNFSFCFFQED